MNDNPYGEPVSRGNAKRFTKDFSGAASSMPEQEFKQ